MSDSVLVAAIAAAGSVLASIIAAMALHQTRETHTLINSRMTELLRLASSAARAEGVAAGEQSQRDRASEADHAS